MNNDFNENEFETTLDALVEYINLLPKATVKMLDFARYNAFMRTAAQLTKLLQASAPAGQIDIDLNETFNLGSISVELDSLTVENPLAFADLIYKADNFEIYPLTNGKIKLDITFQGILKSLR